MESKDSQNAYRSGVLVANHVEGMNFSLLDFTKYLILSFRSLWTRSNFKAIRNSNSKNRNAREFPCGNDYVC